MSQETEDINETVTSEEKTQRNTLPDNFMEINVEEEIKKLKKVNRPEQSKFKKDVSSFKAQIETYQSRIKNIEDEINSIIAGNKRRDDV